MQLNQSLKTLVVIFLLGMTLNTTVFGQQMDIKSKWEIRQGGEILDYREMGDKFAFSSEARDHYYNSLISYKKAKSTGLFTLGALGTGLLLVIYDKPERFCDTICLTTADLLGGALIFIAVPIAGVASLITLKKGINRQKKAVAAFNQNISSIQKEKVSNELVLGFTQNGLGFVYRF